MYVFQEFPKMLYGPNKGHIIVKDREAQDALGDEWSTLPHPEPVASNALTSAAAPVAAEEESDETKEWQALAAKVNLKVNRRWGIETLKARVTEAEALASA